MDHLGPASAQAADLYKGEAARTFSALVRGRKSIRAYLPQPVDPGVIDAVLDDARHAPSNCNTQPWRVRIVSGEMRVQLSAALIRERDSGMNTPDFTFSTADYPAEFAERIQGNGRRIYEPQGIGRHDRGARAAAAAQNLAFFGAPHVAILHMPQVGDNVRIASDLGMFTQTFLLALTARGVGSVAQTSLAQYAGTIKSVLRIPPSELVLLGISFGFADPQAPVNTAESDRINYADFTRHFI